MCSVRWVDQVNPREGIEQKGEVDEPPELPRPQAGITVFDLMTELAAGWGPDGIFSLQCPYNYGRFSSIITTYIDTFRKAQFDPETHLGFIEKFDLNSSVPIQLFIQSSLNGDLARLLKHLDSLQKENLLDAHYRCRPNVHLAFLGDYYQGTEYGTEVLELLMLLHLENPFNVHLLKGDTEGPFQLKSGSRDQNLRRLLESPDSLRLLNFFAECLPLNVFICKHGLGKNEYVQLTNSLFDPTDISELIDHPSAIAHQLVSKKFRLSHRLTQICKDPAHPLYASAMRISEIMKNVPEDVSAKYSNSTRGALAFKSEVNIKGRVSLTIQDVYHWQDLCSAQGRILRFMVWSATWYNMEFLCQGELHLGELRLFALSSWNDESYDSMLISLSETLAESKKRLLRMNRSAFERPVSLTDPCNASIGIPHKFFQ